MLCAMPRPAHPLPTLLAGLAGLLAGLTLAGAVAAAPAAQGGDASIAVPDTWLAIGAVDERGRQPFNPDAVFARYLLDPRSPAPREGERVEGSGDRSDTWRPVAVDEQGRIGGNVSYAYAPLALEEACVALARLRGGATLWVNGDAYCGDVYGAGTPGVPVPLRAGVNHLFVHGVRGAFRLELTRVEPGLLLVPGDTTLPDLVVGRAYRGEGSAVVVNAGAEPVAAVLLGSRGEAGARVSTADWRGAPEGLAPYAVRRLPFGIDLEARADVGRLPLVVELPGGPDPSDGGDGGASLRVELAVRAAGEARRVTFRSGIDGSVQQYSVREPGDDPVDAGIVLTLHGAGVDARNQAASYSTKPDLWIVAPTNRRPFGFDWQDWGRADAYEVLADTLRVHGGDGARVYLTGHSMGGHGAWHLAANDPDRWLAVAPSAGWATFDTYVGRPASSRAAPWRGADLASDTLALLDNLAPLPLYILHGDADDNVPPSEALLMEMLLLEQGGTPVVHLQPGAGHWWDGDASPGADCVDWPPLFAFFRRHRPAEEGGAPDAFEWTSVDPGVDATNRFLTFLQPVRYGEAAHFSVRREGDALFVDTRNVREFSAHPFRQPLRWVVDGTELEPPAYASFLRTGDRWTLGTCAGKRPGRCGPFKRAFARRFVFLVGEDDAQGKARARYDAQLWGYRANGDVPIVSDRSFLAEPGRFAGRNLVLYGNARVNRAWTRVFGSAAPIRADGDAIEVGGRRCEHAAAVFVLPRADDDEALAGAFAYTGPEEARLGYALLPFVSGVGYPDYAVFDARILTGGDGGVLAAGWFDHDWSLGAIRIQD